MSVAIRVEQLSKRYRIGVATQAPTRLRETILQAIGSPFQYLQMMMREPLPEETLWSLRDVSFEVATGEVIGIIGRNGAGKSTLLKILSRITEPTTGYAEILGRAGSLLEVGTGFNPELTGRENIYLNGTIMGMKKREIDRKFDEILEFSGVEKFIDTPVKRYSSGMYVRLAFAVAAHLEPDILIVDEVLAVGDAAFQSRCLGKIKDISQQSGRTVLFVSHSMATVSALCSRCIYLKQGQIAGLGVPSQVIHQYLRDSQDTASTGLANRTDRNGEGDVQVTNLQFLDGQTGQPLNQVISGQDVVIEVSYERRDRPATPLKRFNIGLVFQNTLGQFVMVLNSEMANRAFDTVAASGSVYCRVPRFPLMVGTFFITINLYVNGILSDQIENAVSLEVESGDFFGTGIPNAQGRQGVYVPHSWSHQSPL